MATPNLNLAHIVASQDQKEVTANTAFDGLDLALCGNSPIAMSDADLVLTEAQALTALALVVSGSLTAPRNLVVPSNCKPYVVCNQTTQTVTLKTASGAGVAVAPDGSWRLAYCNGTDVVKLT
jgi:hypothetical protein